MAVARESHSANQLITLEEAKLPWNTKMEFDFIGKGDMTVRVL